MQLANLPATGPLRNWSEPIRVQWRAKMFKNVRQDVTNTQNLNFRNEKTREVLKIFLKIGETFWWLPCKCYASWRCAIRMNLQWRSSKSVSASARNYAFSGREKTPKKRTSSVIMNHNRSPLSKFSKMFSVQLIWNKLRNKNFYHFFVDTSCSHWLDYAIQIVSAWILFGFLAEKFAQHNEDWLNELIVGSYALRWLLVGSMGLKLKLANSKFINLQVPKMIFLSPLSLVLGFSGN